LEQHWEEWVDCPARRGKRKPSELIVLSSPYRYIIQPILDYVTELQRQHPDQQIAVIVPRQVESRWYQRFLYNQRAELLTGLLLIKGNRRIAVVNVPWHQNVEVEKV
jgi:hypothetical protein